MSGTRFGFQADEGVTRHKQAERKDRALKAVANIPSVFAQLLTCVA